MFSDNSNRDNTLLKETLTPFLIVDKKGIIVSLSDDLRREFRVGSNIFEFLKSTDRKKLSDPIISGKATDKNILLHRSDSSTTMNVQIEMMNIEGKELFKLNVLNMNVKGAKNTLKIDLAIGDIEDKLPVDIKSIIDNIKSAYPFTIIGKSKIQKLIDKYPGFFWVKSTNGRIESINKSFSEFLGLLPKEIEGKKEADVFPKYLYKIFKDVNRQVVESGNNILLVDKSGSLFLRHEELKEIVHIPIIDIDGKVVAVIAFTVKKLDSSHLESGLQITTQLDVSDWLIPVLLIDNKGDILSFSQLANEMLLHKSHSASPNFFNFIETGNKKKVEKLFRKEEENSTEFTVEIERKKAHVIVQKIYNSESLPLALIYITPISQDELNTRENMYEMILKNYTMPAFIYNMENLKFLDVNNEALALYGYTREEFLSMDLTDLYAPEDIQSLIEAPNGKRSNGKIIPMRQKRKDGSFIIVEINKNEIDYKGVRAHFSVVNDITEELELEKKLQLYKAAFDNSEDPIAITDVHGFVKFINGAFIEKFGYSKAEIEQNPISSILTDHYRSALITNLFQSEYPEEKKIGAEVKTASNEAVKVDIVGTPIFGYQEKVERFSLIFKIEEPGKIGVPATDAGLGQKGIDSTFLSNLFHELLTPLNVIIGFVQELAESIGEPTEEQREAIQIISENQKVLLQTMDIAVEYSHLEQDYVSLNISSIKFVDLLEFVEDSSKKIAESSEVSLNYGKISSSLQFQSDQHKFSTFLIQMIHFSLIMTHESEIYISGNPYDKDHFVIGIKDKKSGISEELLGNLKAVFTDDEINIRKNFGLSRFTVRLVRKLLEILHGEIRSIPSSAHPHEFGIIFPLKLDVPQEGLEHEMLESVISDTELEDIEVGVRESSIEEVPVVQTPPKTMEVEKEIDLSKLSCLYVEDQVDSQILFKVQMKGLKSMEFANSFEKALPLLRSKKFDFIVMDINLQGEYNGLDALKIIKKMPGYENTPIIAVTAYVVPGAAEKFIQAGFSAFVNKPLLREKLIEALKKIF